MVKTSQFKMNLKARPSRNVFDRSYRVNATAPLGLLRPFFCKEVIAGTKMQLGFENVTRMTNLQAPSFARLHEHIDYFFVPFSQIWKPWEQFRTQQSHYNSSAIQSNMSDRIPIAVPNINISEFYDPLLPGTSFTVSGTGNSAIGRVSFLDSCGYVSNYNRLATLMYLGYGSFFPQTDNHNIDFFLRNYPNVKVNPFRLCAFQKCYYDYYRNEKYEKNEIHAYNLDDIEYSNGIISDFTDLQKRVGLFTDSHYRWRKKDYFMSVTPDLLPTSSFIGFEGFAQLFVNLNSKNQVGGAATGIINSASMPAFSPTATDYTINDSSNPYTSGTTILPSTNNNPLGTLNGYNVSASSLKLMFAREKLLKRMYMAKNNYSAQMMALFGFAPSTMRTDMVYHLGGCANRIIVDDTPIFDGSPGLGEVATLVGRFAGKVSQYSRNPKCAEFTASEDGIVLGIYSTSIENDYAAVGIDRENQFVVPEDYPYQEYQDLGRMPIFRSEFGNFQRVPEGSTQTDGILGFVERYLNYKTSIDKVFYPLADSKAGDGDFDFKRFATPLNTWQRTGSATQTPRISNPQNLYIQTMLVAPWQIDDMVGVVYNGSPKTDAFIINGYNHFKAITPLKEKEF